jgi:hypothetical protein
MIESDWLVQQKKKKKQKKNKPSIKRKTEERNQDISHPAARSHTNTTPPPTK